MTLALTLAALFGPLVLVLIAQSWYGRYRRRQILKGAISRWLTDAEPVRDCQCREQCWEDYSRQARGWKH